MLFYIIYFSLHSIYTYVFKYLYIHIYIYKVWCRGCRGGDHEHRVTAAPEVSTSVHGTAPSGVSKTPSEQLKRNNTQLIPTCLLQFMSKQSDQPKAFDELCMHAFRPPHTARTLQSLAITSTCHCQPPSHPNMGHVGALISSFSLSGRVTQHGSPSKAEAFPVLVVSITRYLRDFDPTDTLIPSPAPPLLRAKIEVNNR